MASSSRFVTACVLLAFTSACSADAVTEPWPSLDTPGAYFASAREPSGYHLYRTISVLHIDTQRNAMFLDEHPGGAETLAEAERLARDASTRFVDGPVIFKEALLRSPHRVVWFRSLTDEER